MRILVLTKRQYTAKDLLDERYGRMFEIPAALERLGHDVRGVALSYRTRPARAPDGGDVAVRWQSINAFPLGLARYGVLVDQAVGDWNPDVVWASSDALHAVLGRRVARRHKAPLVIDLYDNYESFGLTRLPGLRDSYRRACSEADGLTIVSTALDRYVVATSSPSGTRRVIGNGVRLDVFHERDRKKCRVALGLPVEARLVGTVGALTSGRGVSDLIHAFEALAEADPDIWLVCAGPRDSVWGRYSHPRLIDLGVLPWRDAATLICSLDVSVVCNTDSAFGRYCMPLKLQESVACGIPLVAAAVGDVALLRVLLPDRLYIPGDVDSLTTALKHQLDAPVILPRELARSWEDLAKDVSRLLEEVSTCSAA